MHLLLYFPPLHRWGATTRQDSMIWHGNHPRQHGSLSDLASLLAFYSFPLWLSMFLPPTLGPSCASSMAILLWMAPMPLCGTTKEYTVKHFLYSDTSATCIAEFIYQQLARLVPCTQTDLRRQCITYRDLLYFASYTSLFDYTYRSDFDKCVGRHSGFSGGDRQVVGGEERIGCASSVTEMKWKMRCIGFWDVQHGTAIDSHCCL